MAMYPCARGVRLPCPFALPATRASRATVLFVAGFMAYWPIALAGDSAGGGLGAQAMIGAGAVVTKDVPAGALVVGNPAKVVRRKRR